jgi:hypothetical protein
VPFDPESLDLVRNSNLLDDATHGSGRSMLDRVVAMRVGLAKKLDLER